MPVTVVNIKEYTSGPKVYIGRSKNPAASVFGNPYSHKAGTLAAYKVATVGEAVARYRQYAAEQYEQDAVFHRRLNELIRLYQDGGEVVLACWCKSRKNPHAPCHGDVLKEMIEFLAQM
jgi:hypothetical protein